MASDRPSFGSGDAPPEVRARVAALGLLLVVAAILLAIVSRTDPDATPVVPLVVEVRGDVPQPGFHALIPPLRIHAALRAAGLDPIGLSDADLDPGTRVVVEAGGVRLEPMDQLLVVGLPVDVNRATAPALMAIPGIGPRRAADIVADRAAAGPYASVDDLQRVKGIGPATVEQLRPFLSADDGS